MGDMQAQQTHGCGVHVAAAQWSLGGKPTVDPSVGVKCRIHLGTAVCDPGKDAVGRSVLVVDYGLKLYR